jgi:signal peptidase I
MVPAEDVRRGDILMIDVDGATYISRVAALPGDRFDMRQGVVVLNGRPVTHRLIGVEGDLRRLAERFPGEGSDHQIYDTGSGPVDDVEAQTIPSGHFFVL